VGVTVYGANKEVLLDSGTSGWTQPPDAPPVMEARRGRGTLMEDTAVGTRYLTGFARSRGFREYRGLGWYAVVRQPAERVFAPVEALKRSILRWGALLVIGVAIASWIIAGRLARRLHIIGASAERIREGDILSVLPRPKGDSELARMCAALGNMVDDLRAKQETLAAENVRLAAKTREGDAVKR
jgi:methyl-accepting chemotaxis protein